MHNFFEKINSPRSTGSASSSNSLYKRKYSPHIEQRDTPGLNAKRFAYLNNTASPLYCIYCTKNDFESLDQLHAHVQQMHAIVLQEVNIFLNDCQISKLNIKKQFRNHFRLLQIHFLVSILDFICHVNFAL